MMTCINRAQPPAARFIVEDSTTALPSTWPEVSSGNVQSPISATRLERAMMLTNLCWTDARQLLQCWKSDVRSHRGMACTFVAGGIILVSLLTRADLVLLAWIRQDDPTVFCEGIQRTARFLSYWGDFAGFNLFVFATLACFGFIRRSPFFRRMTIAAVLGTALTGGIANAVRLTTGRARPGSGLEAGFYGPTLSARKQSFPSAHTATSFGASIPVAVAFPPAGVPMLIVSGGVAWSRMQNNCHHPSDVMASMILATFFGLPLGLAVRRMQRQTNSADGPAARLRPS